MEDKNGKRIRVFFYNHYTPTGPYMTVCLFLDEEYKAISRGVSICSLLENYNKKTGRNTAYERANDAMISEKSDLPINLGENQERYKYEVVRRKYTAKDEHEADLFVEYLETMGFDYISSINNKLSKKSGEIKERYVFRYYIPRSFPLFVAESYYGNKSEYLPELIDFEKEMIDDVFKLSLKCKK